MGRVEIRAHWTCTLNAMVAVALLLATTTLVLVTFATAKAAGALAVGSCGAYGQAYDYPSMTDAEQSAMAKCHSGECKVVAVIKRGCSALAIDGTNPCGAKGWASGPKLGRAQNEALRSCYKSGGKDCMIRTFLCDAKG
jgi:hypothetical protein